MKPRLVRALCTHHEVLARGEGLDIISVVGIVHVAEDCCHARHIVTLRKRERERGTVTMQFKAELSKRN